MMLIEWQARDDWQQLANEVRQGATDRTVKRLCVPRPIAREIIRGLRAALRAVEDGKTPEAVPYTAPPPVVEAAEPPAPDPVEDHGIRAENARLRKALKAQRAEQYSHRQIREEAFELAGAPCAPPEWARCADYAPGQLGTPTLMLSDLHWGEVVRAHEVYGLNEYDVTVARERLRRVVDRTIDVLANSLNSVGGYPGIYVVLGGDMVSGGIHPELLESDELPPIAAALDLRDHLVSAIRLLADEFGRVYVPCVDGNHDRNTKRTHHKGRVEHSYGWLIYCMLERAFAHDKRVTIQVSEETDLLYTCAGTRYLLTHGDSLGVGGGNGIIGALGPIMRGRHKIASSSAAVGRGHDVLIMGHYHQYIALRNVRVNGTLKGYDEYARGMRFAYEPPSQSLWITHPDHGVTISMPVLADEPREATGAFGGL